MIRTKEKKNCKSDREIKQWLSDKQMTILIKEKVIDFDNYEKPLREVLNPLARHQLGGEPDTKKTIILKRSKTEFKDSILSGFLSPIMTSTEFLSLKSFGESTFGGK